jgi:hypothetical protein
MVQDIIWKADCHSAFQKNILLSLWNPNVHYHNKSPQLDPILSQPNPVHPNDPSLPKVHLNVTSHLHLGLLSGLLNSGLPTKTL